MENTQYSTFKTILVYSAFILLAPISSFFIAKFIIFEGIFGLNNLPSNVWSAVLAVIVLHVALGMYIYRAYFEAEKVKPDMKVD
ncbi:vacuolar ATPase assembly integral membrane protein VMA21 homolog [Aethina tumida]|uniref:vacuolar ATPase assembly integral membrane protein VMA21 homolog n=1 Tax=Aethina tumida TaxID=116153 RepID=UPI00096B2E2A|nr:vacuolar ATPase assembly integral membrane protein VMA21 homolog [Aethina tumida]